MFDAGSAVGKFIIDDSQYKSKIQDVNKSLERVSQTMQKVGTALSISVTAPLIAFGAASIGAWEKQEQALAKMRGTLAATGNVIGTTSKEMEDLAREIQKTSTFSDELVLNSEAILLTFKAVGKTIFPRATKAAVDLSAAFGQDLQQSTVMLGKALQDPIVGMGALRRVGVSLSEEAQNMVKQFVELGNVEEAQKIILGEIEGQVKGVAQAMANTATGSMKQLQNSFGDMQEEIGRLLLESLKPLMDFLREIINGFMSLDDGTKRLIVTVASLAAAVGPVILIVGKLIPLIGSLSGVIAANPIGAFVAVLGLAAAATASLVANTQKEQEAQESLVLITKENILTTEDYKNNVNDLNRALADHLLVTMGKAIKLGESQKVTSKEWGNVVAQLKKEVLEAQKSLDNLNRSGNETNATLEGLTGAFRNESDIISQATVDADTLTAAKNRLTKLTVQLESAQNNYNNSLTKERMEVEKNLKSNEEMAKVRDKFFRETASRTEIAMMDLSREREEYIKAGISKNAIDKWYYGEIDSLRQRDLKDTIEKLNSVKKNYAETAEENFRAWSKANTKIKESTNELTLRQKEAMTKLQQDMTSIIDSLSKSLAGILSVTVTALIKGEDGWKAFAKAGLMAVAQILESLGQMAVVQALINWWNPVAATLWTVAAVAAYTAAALVKVWAGSFALGGDFITNGPQLMLVGDNPGGRERVRVDPISSRNVNGSGAEGMIINFYGPINSELDIEQAMKQAALKLRNSRRSI